MRNEINKLDNNVKQGAQQARVDPFNFPVPGHSLTDAPDKWDWDRPPRMTDPDKVVDFVIDKVESSANTKENFLRMMASGITVEEIVNTVGLAGFSHGEFTPDVAEIIKPALSVYFVGLAIENKVPVVMFTNKNTEEDGKMMSKEATLKVMEERNPAEYDRLMTALSEKSNVKEVNEEPPMEGFMNKGDRASVLQQDFFHF